MDKKIIAIIIFLSLIGIVFALNNDNIIQWKQIGNEIYSLYSIIINHPVTFNNNVTFNGNVYGLNLSSGNTTPYNDSWIKTNFSIYNGDTNYLSIGYNNSRTNKDNIMIGRNHKATFGINTTLFGNGCDGSVAYPVQICNGNNLVYIPKAFITTITGTSWEGSLVLAEQIFNSIDIESPQYWVKNITSLDNFNLARTDSNYIYYGQSDIKNYMYSNLTFQSGSGVNSSSVLNPYWQNVTDQWRVLSSNLSTNLTAYTDFSGFNVTLLSPNNYTIMCNLMLRSNVSTTGINFRITSTNTPKSITWTYTSPADRGATEASSGTETSKNTLPDTGGLGPNIYYHAVIQGYISTNSTSNNYISWEYASEISGSWIELSKGSRCVYTIVRNNIDNI